MSLTSAATVAFQLRYEGRAGEDRRGRAYGHGSLGTYIELLSQGAARVDIVTDAGEPMPYLELLQLRLLERAKR